MKKVLHKSHWDCKVCHYCSGPVCYSRKWFVRWLSFMKLSCISHTGTARFVSIALARCATRANGSSDGCPSCNLSPISYTGIARFVSCFELVCCLCIWFVR